MKMNLEKSTVTARISFGIFNESNEWVRSAEPVVYTATTKNGGMTAKCDCHLSLDDGTVITVPAYGATANQLARMRITDSVTGEIRGLRNGDLVTVNIPGTTYKNSHAYRDERLGVDLMGDFHNAPFFNFATGQGVVAASSRGMKMFMK